LDGESGQLLHPVQDLEISGKPLEAARLKKTSQAKFDPGAVAERFVAFTAFAQWFGDIVTLLVFGAELCNGFIAGCVDVLHQITNAVAVYRIAESGFGRHFVAFGDGHFTHVVFEASDSRSLPIVPAANGPHPRRHTGLYFLIGPVAN